MKKYLKFLLIFGSLYFVGCGDSSDEATQIQTKEPVATVENSVAVAMPILPNTATLPTDTLEVK